MSQHVPPPAPDSFTPAPDPAPARAGNPALGIAAAAVTALVAAVAYGVLMNAIDRQVAFAAVAVGLLVGIAAGRVGGRSAVLPPLAAALSLAAVYLGQLTSIALAAADFTGTGVLEVVATMGLDGLNGVWKEHVKALDFLFLAIGTAVAFGLARKAGT
ncbi:hypothetical protein [Streptomyces sp. NPDC051567]|uniref:hypothetical protein n=1 Tax=Streptomyces sp. NPDC051567 TaxID=3365660 RepID=UPI0037AA925C